MRLINYEFIKPNILEDILCKLLIINQINYCSLKYDNYIEIHFDNYIVRIKENSKKIVFNTDRFSFIINNINNKNIVNNIRQDGFNNLLLPTKFDLSKYYTDNKNNKYKDINYISKKKMLHNSNKNNRVNTKRK